MLNSSTTSQISKFFLAFRFVFLKITFRITKLFVFIDIAKFVIAKSIIAKSIITKLIITKFVVTKSIIIKLI